jgi:hypothetical protein
MLVPVIGIIPGKVISSPMRKKQSHLLYSRNMPVQHAAFSSAIAVAKVGFPSLAKYLLHTPEQTKSLHKIKHIHKSISSPAVDENISQLRGCQNQ